MGKQRRLIFAGTSIASALLLFAGGATAAQATTAHHVAEHHSAAVHHRGERHRTGRNQRTRRWYRQAGQSQCEMWARAHIFEHLKAAHHAPGGAATLTAERATVVCGEADDWHF